MHATSEEVSDTTRRLAQFEATVENAKAQLSRSLHDDLGGLLVSAVMDSAWAEQHVIDNPQVRERLARVRTSLAAAIDLKRSVIEALRPSLLENFGLIATLRWYHKHNCEQARIACSETYPDEEPPFTPDASTALFRIAQEGLTTVMRHKSAKHAHLGLCIEGARLCLQINHDGEVLTAERRDEADRLSQWLVEHRVRALGGLVSMANPATGGMHLRVEVPLRNVLV
jgi:signal transduction histidine kinase